MNENQHILDDIQKNLDQIAASEDVVILHAVESGSRAWGFASSDSDFDVRFIYLRKTEHYLKLEDTRDVIEWKLDEVLDINGWDLQKMLRLLFKSNPTIFEWANSPIIYRTTPAWKKLSKITNQYFLSKHGIFHYLHMAEGNFREYLKGDIVRVKKYLYVLRPILACKWIFEHKTSPPMLFNELVQAVLEPNLMSAVQNLLEIKINCPERETVPKIEVLNSYIEKNLLEINQQVLALPKESKGDIDQLNEVFLGILREYNKNV